MIITCIQFDIKLECVIFPGQYKSILLIKHDISGFVKSENRIRKKKNRIKIRFCQSASKYSSNSGFFAIRFMVVAEGYGNNIASDLQWV